MFNKLFNVVLALFGLGSDVITVTSGTYTAGTTGAAGSVAADLITYLAAQLLEVAELNMVLDQFGDKVPLPPGSSLTIRFVREEKLSVSSSPTQLTQGLPPDAIGISMTGFEAVIA